MVKHIRLLGMELPNYSLREEILKAEESIKKAHMQIFLTLSMAYLVKAGTNQTVRATIDQADLLLIEDKEILSVAGIHSSQRIREASEHIFFDEFMKRLVRNERTAFLLADTEEDLRKIREILLNRYEKIKIVGQYTIEARADDMDYIINEINCTSTDVVISVLSSPLQDCFLRDHKNKIDARIWYSLGTMLDTLTTTGGLKERFKKLIRFGTFKLHVNRYHKKDGNED